MKIVTIVGARPQFIKAAMVSRAFAAAPSIEEVLVHTGQHYDDNMSQVFFDELDLLRPRHELSVGSCSHGAQTGRMLEAIEKVLVAETPEYVLVYGDTNSTLAGALASKKMHIPVAHVEAGLRSFNRRMPEEINRVVTDHVSDVLFAPTAAAVENLHREGIGENVHLVGDVMYDAALFCAQSAAQHSAIMSNLKLQSREYVLATVHRAENTDQPDRLNAIVEGLVELSNTIPVVMPLHPRTQQALQRCHLLDMVRERIRTLPPVGYLDMVMLEQNARVIATDSGGVQKEAFFYRVPCVTLRDETEWVELVESGWNVVTPPRTGVAVAKSIMAAFGALGQTDVNPYGSGNASQRIADALVAGLETRHFADAS